MKTQPAFLPATFQEMKDRGWNYVDIVLVTGDAYIDHPSFGIAVIGRWLEAHGYRVAVLSQPRHDDPEDFKTFGCPRLFFGISAGNLDSIVANYTGNARVRKTDAYSPGGSPYFPGKRGKKWRRRPDRATIRYSQLAREAFRDVPIVLGGIEASLRRFVHYDYQQEALRASVLTDAKADLLVYGMGERAVLEIARALKEGRPLKDIPGTCERITEGERISRNFSEQPLVLPSWAEIQKDKTRFLDAELLIDRQARSLSPRPLLQEQKAMWVLQNRPSAPLSSQELDYLYSLPFIRQCHPSFKDVPAYRMIRHSITIVRGCMGNCSFCAIARHQGPVITSRSQESVRKEVEAVASMPDFHGTISDLGGPTANLYGVRCTLSEKCIKRDCLYPDLCPNLVVDERPFLELLDMVSRSPGVRHAYVSSGLRMDLLLKTPKLLKRIIIHHMPGAIKIAPEHTEAEVLRLMHKPDYGILERFVREASQTARSRGKRVIFNPYFISAHPGCTLQHMEALARKVRRLGLSVRQFQDFTPTPGTISTAMYVSGLDRYSKEPIHVPRTRRERRLQRQVLERARGRR